MALPMPLRTPAQVLLAQACFVANQAVFRGALGQEHVEEIADALAVARFEAVANDDQDTLQVLALIDDPDIGVIKLLTTWANERA